MKAIYLNFKDWCEYHYNGIADFAQRIFLSGALSIGVLTAAMLLASCSTSKAVTDVERGEISWRAFCDARGYDYNNTSYLVTNEYLDAWCGSVEEENAFIKAGVEPY